MTFIERSIKHALICIVLMLLLTLVVVFSPKSHLGFFGYIALFIVGSVFTTIGVIVGDEFRRFVHPDAIMSSGALDTFKQKIFWKIGPQSIGWAFGAFAADNLVIKMIS